MTRMKALVLVLVSALLSGCVRTHRHAAGLPKAGPAVVAVTTQAEQINNGVPDSKTGKACSRSILGLVAVGDASVEAAKRNGNIQNVYVMNREILGINVYIPLYGESCTVIHGS